MGKETPAYPDSVLPISTKAETCIKAIKLKTFPFHVNLVSAVPAKRQAYP